MVQRSKTFVLKLLAACEIEVGGSRPFDVTVHDDRLYDRLMTQGTLALGEAYMDGWWDAPEVDQFLYRLIRADVQSRIKVDLALLVSAARGALVNLQRLRVTEVGEKHYDIGNDLYRLMLDPRMIYSCGYWKDAQTLAQAQEAKLDLICRKLGLEPGMRILDVGSGWGGFLKFAAARYGIEGLGVTISKEQAAFANADRDGLPVETRLTDYMALEGKFDRVISIGMFEHVGHKNYRSYMQKMRSLLAPEGLFLLHTIGGGITVTHGDPWSEKYIFPNGMLPSIRQIGASIERLFVMEDWHNFGADYDRTLMAWHANFERGWPQIKSKYGDKFYRMWRYYLLSFAAIFRARDVNLWQIVLSPRGIAGGYARVT